MDRRNFLKLTALTPALALLPGEPASPSVAKRSYTPPRVVKLGYVPTPEQERRLLELLAKAEADPTSWKIYNYDISSKPSRRAG